LTLTYGMLAIVEGWADCMRRNVNPWGEEASYHRVVTAHGSSYARVVASCGRVAFLSGSSAPIGFGT
jgi:hypothetical protein